MATLSGKYHCSIRNVKIVRHRKFHTKKKDVNKLPKPKELMKEAIGPVKRKRAQDAPNTR